jgi:prolyl-tRNA editing enzyme YbaK/EbsC (Cys-tRNA(Pro) deacylase)/GNAT superfamily N-acetyltransferase
MAHFFMARFGRDLPAYEMPAGVSIRTFAPGDEETFLRCCAGGELGTESWSLADVREKLLGKPGVAPERIFFAQEENGRVGATTTAVFEEGRGYIHMVAADPAFRGKGLGKAACYAAVRCLVEAGYAYIVLETDDFRAPALHIYDWLGFVRIGVPDRVREALDACGFADRIREYRVSTATVDLAAQAVGCEPARIAKTLSFSVGGGCALIVCAGDARIDNAKFKARFHEKARMLPHEQVQAITGHPVGGVCPFAAGEAAVYLDQSLRRFPIVFPAAGGANTAVRLTPEELQRATGGEWIDVCRIPQGE